MRSRATRIVLWLVWIAIGGLAVYVFVMFGPLAVEERISKPSFCVTCHNMKPEYDAFNRGPHGNLDSCNACHLPNNNPVSHQFWDAVFGMKDLIGFNTGNYPQQPNNIEATDISQRMIQANCPRCHGKVIGLAGIEYTVLISIDNALQQLATSSAQLGAYQNRFQAAITGLTTNSTNLTSARSLIQDTDYAQATSQLSKAQILQQAGTAMLSQANALPNLVLSLLKSHFLPVGLRSYIA